MRGVRQGVYIGAVAALLLAFAASSAFAGSVRYSGRTAQGQKVVMRTDSDGRLKTIAFHFRSDCSNGHRFRAIQSFVRPFDNATASKFNDYGRYRRTFDGGRAGKFDVGMAGHRVSADRFRGTFRFKGTYFDHGDKYATCRTPKVRWSATHH